MVSDNEFSHVVKLSEIGSHSRNIHLSADDAARTGLMARFDLAGLDQLEADISLKPDGTDILVTGQFTASFAQYCIASNDPVPALLDEPIHIRFVPAPVVGGEVEVELGNDEYETMFQDGQTIDLGEAIAQSLGLALDPYPRSPDAEKILKAAGVKAEGDIVPTGALASLKDLMAKK